MYGCKQGGCGRANSLMNGIQIKSVPLPKQIHPPFVTHQMLHAEHLTHLLVCPATLCCT